MDSGKVPVSSHRTVKPGLTLIVMVKNDPERLRRCLQSAMPYADQTIVQDTGSSDNTVEVARECGAQVVVYPWPGAFDDALNNLIAQVQTEWTLRLDSDEWLDPGQEAVVEAVTSRDDILMANVVRHDYGPEGDYATIFQARLWRTDPRMRVRGVIHEQFWPDILDAAADGRIVVNSELIVHHDGYASTELRAEKMRRNLALIERELEVRPDQLFYEVCRADTLIDLGDPEGPERADEIIHRFVRTNTLPSEANVAILFYKRIVGASDEEIFSPRIGKMARFARQSFFMYPAVMWALSGLEVRKGNLREAMEIMIQLDHFVESGSLNFNLNVNPIMAYQGCWNSIVEFAEQLGRRDLVAHYQAKLAQAPS